MGEIFERGDLTEDLRYPSALMRMMRGMELDSVLSRIATNRPFPHSRKQTHQLEARVDKIYWFVWNCSPEPCPHFFLFSHWSRNGSIAAIFWKNCFPVIKHNSFQLACLTSALWAKRGEPSPALIYLGYTSNESDIFKLQATGSMGRHLPEKIPKWTKSWIEW